MRCTLEYLPKNPDLIVPLLTEKIVPALDGLMQELYNNLAPSKRTAITDVNKFLEGGWRHIWARDTGFFATASENGIVDTLAICVKYEAIMTGMTRVDILGMYGSEAGKKILTEYLTDLGNALNIQEIYRLYIYPDKEVLELIWHTYP